MNQLLKQRPILFAAPMVRAILEGRKTQTRRVIQPRSQSSRRKPEIKCRFGQPGDQLWVRERFGYRRQFDNPSRKDGGPVVYAADPDSMNLKGAWRQSRYMPRKVSRIILRISAIRAERLNSMTLKDARAEGMDSIAAFRELWDSINADRGLGWDANPWVWVISFSVVPPV